MAQPRGFLHFDVRSGLTLPLLNAALFELACDKDCIEDALKACGLSPALETRPFKLSVSPGLQFTLTDIKDKLAHKKPQLCALAVAALENLKLLGPISGEELAELLALCAQIDKLDPKFISSSKIHLSSKNAASPSLNEVVVGLPVVEVEETIETDILAIAFLKTVVGQWGARGEHTLLKVGTGKSQQGFLEALWCEASLPESMSECGPSNKARVLSSYEISGLTPAFMDMNQLSLALSLHGALSVSWHLVHGEKGQSFNRVRFLCTNDDKRDAIEAFLIKGEASQVVVKTVEQHELNRRQVFIPMGTGNKTYSMRFWEYIYYDKIVRVVPLKEDLDQYIIKTDYSADVARSDAMLAWKKWRGRAFEDK